MTQVGKDAPEKKREKRTITEIRGVEDHRREDGLHVGAGLHERQVGGDGGRRRRGRRRQPGDDRPRPSLHHPRHHGHDGDARAGDPPRRAQHIRAGVHALPELQHRRPRADERHALHAAGGLGRGQAAGRQVPGADPEGAGRCRHPHRLAHRLDPAHHRHVRRLQDPGPHGGCRHEDPGGRARHRGRRLLHAGVRGGAGQDRQADLRAADHPHHRHRRGRRHRRADPALPRPARRLHRLQAEVHQALRQADRGGRHRHQAVHQGGEGGLLPRRRPLLHGQGGGVREVRQDGGRSASRSEGRSSWRNPSRPRRCGSASSRRSSTTSRCSPSAAI